MKKVLFVTLFFVFQNLAFAQNTARVVIIVEDLETNKPVAGAYVSIDQAGGANKSTGGDGKVTFDGVPVGRIDWRVMAPGYQYKMDYANVLPPTEGKDNTFHSPLFRIPTEKDPTILITGQVNDADGRDLEKVCVEVRIADVEKTVLTNESGNFSLDITPNPKFPASIARIEVKKDDCKFNDQIELNGGKVFWKSFILDCSGEAGVSDPESAGKQGQPEEVTQKLGDWGFTLKGCERSGNNVTCKLVVTSNFRDRKFQLNGTRNPKSAAFDELGGAYAAGSAKVGNFQDKYFVIRGLIANIPTPVEVIFPNISTQATKFPRLDISIIADELAEKTVQFRDVPIK